MQFVIDGASYRHWHLQCPRLKGILLPSAKRRSINVIQKIHVPDVDFPRRDSDDGSFYHSTQSASSHGRQTGRPTVFSVQVFDLPNVLSGLDDIVVELVPRGQGCQPGAGDVSEGTGE